MLLNIVEAACEFCIGTFQGIIGVELVESCCVDDREEKVAKLIGGSFFVLALKFLL